MSRRVRLLTAAAVARRLNLRRDAVYGLLRRRELAGIRIGRRWRIAPAALEAFVAEHTHAVAEEPGALDDRQLALFEPVMPGPDP